VIRALALALLLALPAGAAAQRPRCGYGEALAALRGAEAGVARPVTGLSEGRAQAASVQEGLRGAVEVLAGCGCRRAAADAADAALLAEAAAQEGSAQAIAVRLQRAGFSLRLVRERLAGQGCS
jgi:hypothetical protein